MTNIINNQENILKQMHNNRACQISDINFGNAVKLIRKNKKLSQHELGQIIGVSAQQIQKYENGKNRISASTIKEIAKALETDVSLFYNIDLIYETIQENNIKIDKSSQNMIVELITAFYKINNNMIKYNIINLIKSLSLSEDSILEIVNS